jgi:predicted AAA+ superfamily ATPase
MQKWTLKMALLKREMTTELTNMGKMYPVVTVVGMRQTGKTTLVRVCYPDKAYVNLENIDERTLAEEDPRRFLARYPSGAIIDEIQRVPSLLSYIQTTVDESQEMGLFILTGSHQLALQESISQSLAGRTAILKLYPLSLAELNENNISQNIDQNILRGGFPKLYQATLEPTKYYANYTQTYLERDVRQLINLKDLTSFQKFMRLCAGRVACPLNTNNLANETGVSATTINAWLSVLEASYIIYRLAPLYENVGKRLTKTPKLYFADVGLASYLLGIETEQQLERDPARGRLFENMVLLEILKKRANQGLAPNVFYYRDKSQLEVDIVYQQGHQLTPIEVKSGQTYQKEYGAGLKRYMTLLDERAPKGYIVYGGQQEQEIGAIELVNYQYTANIVIDS